MEQHSCPYLNQVLQMNIIINTTYGHHVPPHMMLAEGNRIAFAAPWYKT